MKRLALTLGAASILLGASAAFAQNLTFPPGTSCNTVPATQRAACMGQAQSLSGNTGATTVPNSANSNTVNGVTGSNPNTVILPNARSTTTGVTGSNPNTVILPNEASPTAPPAGATSTTVAPTTNGVTVPNSTSSGQPTVANPGTVPAPQVNPVIIPPAGTGTTGTGGASGGAGVGTTGN